MAFLYKAFIRKNSPELRTKLEDLGYTNGAWETPRFHYPYLSVWPNPKFGLFKGEGFYMTEDDYRLDGKVWEYKPKEDVIDCGDNEQLFLAVAALRDDIDKHQWFIFENPGLYDDYPEKIWVYIFEENELEKYRKECIKLNKPILSYHKAMVEELIQYFNK